VNFASCKPTVAFALWRRAHRPRSGEFTRRVVGGQEESAQAAERSVVGGQEESAQAAERSVVRGQKMVPRPSPII
jgi:hypothetical protein